MCKDLVVMGWAGGFIIIDLKNDIILCFMKTKRTAAFTHLEERWKLEDFWIFKHSFVYSTRSWKIHHIKKSRWLEKRRIPIYLSHTNIVEKLLDGFNFFILSQIIELLWSFIFCIVIIFCVWICNWILISWQWRFGGAMFVKYFFQRR